MNGTIIYLCPLCDWNHQEPRFPTERQLSAGWFGEQNQRVEAALQKHLSGHTAVEWLQKVTSLQSELTKLKATFP